MRKKNLTMVSTLLICHFFAVLCFADNPIVQTIYTADPAPFVYNDVVYAYFGHDEDGDHWYFDMRDWRLFSTTDMVNWTDCGVPMNLKTFSWARTDAWAGHVVYRNSKFYYYVPVRLQGEPFGIGVGVSDKPEGPFTDAIGKPLISGNGYIDPSVFIDDDGQAYMYIGNPSPYMVKLNANMISISGTVTQLSEEGFNRCYLEGPWLYKRNELYYWLYSSDCVPGNEDIRYSTSSSPAGPWKYRGIIQPVQKPQTAWTNHSGVINYKGNSYFFYHTGNLPGGDHVHRSVCVEQFKFNDDGTIPDIPQTKEGPPQIGHLNPFDTTQAETICWSVGLKTGTCSEGGMNVDSIHNGDYIKIKGVDFGSGATSFNARVASGTSGGSIEIHLNTLTGPLIGTCSIQGTGGWQTWTTKSCTVISTTGVHDLYLKFTGGSGRLFNFNWWKFGPEPTGINGTEARYPISGNAIKMTVDAGKILALRLDFSQNVSQRNVNVSLFDLNGRLIVTLFTGQLSTRKLSLPLNQTNIHMGVYVVTVSMDDEIALTKTVSLQ